MFHFIKCLFGFHNWGRWTYRDSNDRTQLVRECLNCHKREGTISHSNDLFDTQSSCLQANIVSECKGNCNSQNKISNLDEDFQKLAAIYEKEGFYRPQEKNEVDRNCLFGFHDWGRWIYLDCNDKTKLVRECLRCHKREERIAETNDLV